LLGDSLLGDSLLGDSWNSLIFIACDVDVMAVCSFRMVQNTPFQKYYD
jgi:hypothetical protein